MGARKGYQPTPTVAVPTGMHQVIPNRNPSIASVRRSFDDTFGAYVPPDWTLDAECTRPGVDPGLFYPTRGGANTGTKKALQLCASCVVRETCLADVLAFEVGDVGSEDVRPEVHGVRGGMAERARRSLVQKIRVERAEKTKAAVLAEVAGTDKPVEEIAANHGVPESTVYGWIRKTGTVRGGAL